jgi:preprotein translocase subunit SecD
MPGKNEKVRNPHRGKANSKKTKNLIFIIPLAILALLIAIPTVPINVAGHDIYSHLGLDLVGGVQVLLEADVPADVEVTSKSMETARTIISNRANGMLGVGEALVQAVGERRIAVELPGETDPASAIAVLGETGQLEFVDMGTLSSNQARDLVGTTLVTDYPTTPKDIDPSTQVYHTIMAGTDLDQVGVQQSKAGEFMVVFSLNTEGAKTFRDYTTNNVGKYLAIVLDKEVISIPVVKTAITGGSGSISGNFTAESANDLAIQLRYGALPIPLKVVESRTIGPSLGQDSLTKSLVAGLIGFGFVVLFMVGYYRLPGLLADLALIVYIAITMALFKLIPVTMTLPGIAGFVLSIGVAVDANILIFERMKEELREGRRLNQAIDMGWDRAWPSIRDSNFSTLITCTILFWFGNAFGASVVKGFAVTLALGVGVSLFTAIIVTRSFLHLFLDKIRLADHHRWFGV